MGIVGLCLGPASPPPPPPPKGDLWQERKQKKSWKKKKNRNWSKMGKRYGKRKKKRKNYRRDSRVLPPPHSTAVSCIGAPLASVWGPGGWASRFRFQTTMWKLLYVIYEIWLIFRPYAHSYEKYVKINFFCLWTRTSKRLYLCASKSYIKCAKYPRRASWGFNGSDKYKKYI